MEQVKGEPEKGSTTFLYFEYSRKMGRILYIPLGPLLEGDNYLWQGVNADPKKSLALSENHYEMAGVYMLIHDNNHGGSENVKIINNKVVF